MVNFVIGAAPGSHAHQDFHDVSLHSQDYAAVRNELQSMENDRELRCPRTKSSGLRRKRKVANLRLLTTNEANFMLQKHLGITVKRK